MILSWFYVLAVCGGLCALGILAGASTLTVFFGALFVVALLWGIVRLIRGERAPRRRRWSAAGSGGSDGGGCGGGGSDGGGGGCGGGGGGGGCGGGS